MFDSRRLAVSSDYCDHVEADIKLGCVVRGKIVLGNSAHSPLLVCIDGRLRIGVIIAAAGLDLDEYDSLCAGAVPPVRRVDLSSMTMSASPVGQR